MNSKTRNPEDLNPVSFSGDLKSISDDDLCSDCTHCHYCPGELSGCAENWPGRKNCDGYVTACDRFMPVYVAVIDKIVAAL